MRVSRSVLAFVLILFVGNVTFGKVRVDYDHGANFGKYKTFMWLEEPNTDDPIMETRIVNAINNQLCARGLEQVTTDADLAIKVTSSTKEIPTFYTYYDNWWGPGFGWGWGGGGTGWATTYVDTSLEATTVVDLIDVSTEKPVWHGVSQGYISDKAERATKKTLKRIGEMFEDYPFLRTAE